MKTIKSENNKSALIFTTVELLKAMEESNEIFMDGTFSVNLLLKL